jgi:hypothetical protein
MAWKLTFPLQIFQVLLMPPVGKTPQCRGASRCVPQHAFPQVPPMGRALGVGVQRTPVATGTAGARQGGRCTFRTKA